MTTASRPAADAAATSSSPSASRSSPHAPSANAPLAPPASSSASTHLAPPDDAPPGIGITRTSTDGKPRGRVARGLSELITSQLVPGNMAKSHALLSNFGVDYVLVFQYEGKDKATTEQRFEALCRRLSRVGLATEVRTGESGSLLVFIRVASEEHLFGEVYRSRVKDWIHGVRSAEPAKDTRTALQQDPLTQAERLRLICQLIVNPEAEGGAGITPNKGEWEDVQSLFALHDHAYNKEWIKKWSRQWLLSPEDLDEIRNRFGAKVGFYFAFTQSYLTFLTVPAVFGSFSWLVLGYFSPWYAIVASVWCVVFTEWWQHQEEDLALRWGVRGVSNVEAKRLEFQPKHELTDPVTGETLKVFPAKDRLKRQVLQLPFAVAAVVVLGSLIAMCFAIEIFISEVYSGPLKSILVFLPTAILTVGMPFLTGILTSAAKRLSDYENYETESQYERSLTAKTFVLNFVTAFLPVFLTAFVYVPFGSLIVPYLDVFSLTVRPFADDDKELETPDDSSQFSINPARLRKQVIYFTVTAQIVNFGMEVIVPYLKRQGYIKYKEMRANRQSSGSPSPAAEDPPEEKEFLARVRSEAELGIYNSYDDLQEMVVQFGYMALFSVIWPLVPVSFLINNWVELRADAVKICVEKQRPTPWRADSIGPWLDALSFLAWLGSITMAALVYMFRNDGVGPDGSPADLTGWSLLLAIFFSEHLYLGARWAVRTAIAKIESPGRMQARRAMYTTRQAFFRESLAQTSELPAVNDQGEDEERPSREVLEEEARKGSLSSATPEERFWARQRGWRKTVKWGKGVIAQGDVGGGVVGEREKKEL